MDILFVGSVIPNDLCIKHKGNSVAANKMQLGIIQSLSKIPDCNVQVLSTYPIASYPREKVLGMRKKYLFTKTGEKIVSIPFVNIFIFKQITQILGQLSGLITWKKVHNSCDGIIISFNAFTEFSFPILLISRIFKIHNVCILADLPFHVIQYGLVRQFASKMQIRSTLTAIKKFDGLIVLNKEAQKRYAPHLPFCIINGGINAEEYKKPINFGGAVHSRKNNKKKVILFTGALIEYNGIINLIKAIKKMENKQVIFKFYGDGPLIQFIKNESLLDDRIQYCGFVSNDEILKIQMESSFLINPRPTNELISQVTFPSKIMEYMMSGTPILTTKLNGLVDEYADCLFFIDDDPIKMANDIDKALEIDEEFLILKSKLAYKFVVENKNWDVQVKTIYNFLNRIIKAGSNNKLN